MIVEQISVQELAACIERGERPCIVDVRTPEEFERVRIEGARLVPLSILPLEEERLPQREPIYFFCHSGARSQQAARWWKERHPEQRVCNVAGGLVAWVQAGLPVIFEEEDRRWA